MILILNQENRKYIFLVLRAYDQHVYFKDLWGWIIPVGAYTKIVLVCAWMASSNVEFDGWMTGELGDRKKERVGEKVGRYWIHFGERKIGRTIESVGKNTQRRTSIGENPRGPGKRRHAGRDLVTSTVLTEDYPVSDCIHIHNLCSKSSGDPRHMPVREPLLEEAKGSFLSLLLEYISFSKASHLFLFFDSCFLGKRRHNCQWFILEKSLNRLPLIQTEPPPKVSAKWLLLKPLLKGQHKSNAIKLLNGLWVTIHKRKIKIW